MLDIHDAMCIYRYIVYDKDEEVDMSQISETSNALFSIKKCLPC